MSAANAPLERDAKITDLLLKGNSVDTLTEHGVHRGWTRADVLRVASENGWKLDASGRIPRDQRTPRLAPVPTPATVTAPAAPPAGGPPPLFVALRDGRTHGSAAIRRKADRIHEQLQALAKDIEAEAEKQKARERIAELERELAAAKAAAKGSAQARPSTVAPGESTQQIREWAAKQGITVPARGRIPKAVVKQWREATK